MSSAVLDWISPPLSICPFRLRKPAEETERSRLHVHRSRVVEGDRAVDRVDSQRRGLDPRTCVRDRRRRETAVVGVINEAVGLDVKRCPSVVVEHGGPHSKAAGSRPHTRSRVHQRTAVDQCLETRSVEHQRTADLNRRHASPRHRTARPGERTGNIDRARPLQGSTRLREVPCHHEAAINRQSAIRHGQIARRRGHHGCERSAGEENCLSTLDGVR